SGIGRIKLGNALPRRNRFRDTIQGRANLGQDALCLDIRWSEIGGLPGKGQSLFRAAQLQLDSRQTLPSQSGTTVGSRGQIRGRSIISDGSVPVTSGLGAITRMIVPSDMPAVPFERFEKTLFRFGEVLQIALVVPAEVVVRRSVFGIDLHRLPDLLQKKL